MLRRCETPGPSRAPVRADLAVRHADAARVDHRPPVGETGERHVRFSRAARAGHHRSVRAHSRPTDRAGNRPAPLLRHRGACETGSRTLTGRRPHPVRVGRRGYQSIRVGPAVDIPAGVRPTGQEGPFRPQTVHSTPAIVDCRLTCKAWRSCHRFRMESWACAGSLARWTVR
jgi:hypothetical protein